MAQSSAPLPPDTLGSRIGDIVGDVLVSFCRALGALLALYVVWALLSWFGYVIVFDFDSSPTHFRANLYVRIEN